MLNFQAVRNNEISSAASVADLSLDNLRDLTHKMIDIMLRPISGCVDADVVLGPLDPNRFQACGRVSCYAGGSK
jgi:hypothetical protein